MRLRVRTLSNQTPAANNGTTHYVWDISGRIIAEANGSTGATLRETIYLPTGAGEAMPIAAVNAAVTPKLTYAVHVDHLNRPIMLTDASKTNVWWAAYEPFGRVRATGGTLTQNLGLPGQWFQLEQGLAYNWHRHYDPSTGRYTTADPLGFVDGPSVFAYAGNAPHTDTDADGLNSRGGRNWSYRQQFPWIGPNTIPSPNSTAGRQVGPTCNPFNPQGGVYVMRRPDGTVVYVGRTNNFDRRDSEHARDPRFNGLTFDPIFPTNNRNEQRGLEQSVFNSFNPIMNRINPVSPTNPSIQTYIGAARTYLGR